MRRFGARAGLSILSGCLVFLACPSFDLRLLMWLAFVPQLLVALSSTTSRGAFGQGWLSGCAAIGGGFYWMFALFQRFGRMSAGPAALLTALFVGYTALEWGFLSWAVRRLRARTGLPVALLAPLCFVSCELLLPQVFPFSIALSQSTLLPLVQIADVTGTSGVTFLLLAVNGSVVDVLLARREARPMWRTLLPLVVAAVGVALVSGYGFLRIKQIDTQRGRSPRVRVGLVEAHTPTDETHDSAVTANSLETHQRLSAELAAQGVDLVVWPESAYPQEWPRARTSDFPLDDARRVRRRFATPLLFGASTRAAGPSATSLPPRFNSAVMLDANGDVAGTYDKVRLVPFSECVPFDDWLPSLSQALSPHSRFERGAGPVVLPFVLGEHAYRLGPLICYEDVLPTFVRRVAALKPHLFVNLTNDAWFGDTSEPYEHLALAIFRSVEHRLDMVRAVNSGVSAHVDATGRVRRSTPAVDSDALARREPRTMVVDAALMAPSGLYGSIGDAFGYTCVGALVLMLLWRPLRRATRSAQSPNAKTAAEQ